MSTETPNPSLSTSPGGAAEPPATEGPRPNPNGDPNPATDMEQCLRRVPPHESKGKEPRHDNHDLARAASAYDSWHAVPLLVVVVLLLGLATYVVFDGLQSSNRSYRAAVQLAQDYAEHSRDRPGYRPDLALLYMTQSARVQDQVFLKCTALLLGSVIVLVGFVFVWLGAGAFYRMSAQHSHIRSAMQTTSPGLVLIGVGAALVVAIILVPLHLETRFDWGETSQATASPAAEPLLPLQAAPSPAEANRAYQKSLERSGRADR